eukprot:194806-Hanusia_phi.AAC.1
MFTTIYELVSPGASDAESAAVAGGPTGGRPAPGAEVPRPGRTAVPGLRTVRGPGRATDWAAAPRG